jgi:hypothetical protein
MSNHEDEPDYDDEGMEIDPALAAAMGFTGFGAQPSKKKRKFDNDSFVDPSIGRPQGNGANSTPIGRRKPQGSMGQSQDLPQTKVQSAVPAEQSGGGQAEVAFREGRGGDSGRPDAASSAGPPSLEALRWGVKNERGDLVVFMPSFLEDPWTALKT